MDDSGTQRTTRQSRLTIFPGCVPFGWVDDHHATDLDGAVPPYEVKPTCHNPEQANKPSP